MSAGILFTHSVYAQTISDKLDIALQQKNYSLALQLIEEGLNIQPDNDSLAYLKGNTMDVSGNTKGALDYFQALIEKPNNKPMPFLAIANIHLKQGSIDQWRSALEATIKAHPDDPRAYLALGNDHLEMAKQYLVAASQTSINPVLNKQVALVVAAQSAELVMTTTSYQGNAEEAGSSVPALSEEQMRQQIVSTLRAWSRAWSSQVPADYFKFYAPEFSPSNGDSIERWSALKTKKLTETEFINIKLTDLQIAVGDADNAKVKFKQRYDSSTYNGLSNKQLKLRRHSDGWKIISESEL